MEKVLTNFANVTSTADTLEFMDLVSIIIVSWNGLHWLKRSLPTIFSQSYKNIEVILVDNSSIDETVPWVSKNFPKVKIIALKENKGFAEGNNRGYEHAKGKYILFLNNDVEVTPAFLVELVRVVKEKPEVAGAQSKILLLDNPKQLDSIGAFLTRTGFLYHYAFMNNDQKRFDREINLFTPKGACMLFKKEILQKVEVQGKIFDVEAFAYFEETDMAHRIWLHGHRIVYAPKSIIYHKMGGTSTTMDSAYIQYHSFKNRIHTYIKNLEVASLAQILPVHLFCCEVFATLYLIRGKVSVFFAIQRAILWNIVSLNKTLKKRKIIQTKIRKVSDSEYFPLIYRNAPLGFYIAQSKGKPYAETVVL